MEFELALFQRVKKLPLNHSGRDFFCGDIHGELGLLESLLERLTFNPQTDRLIATGDLIDRGKSSQESLQLLTQPWFYSVVGNHEQLLLSCNEKNAFSKDRWFANGGQWWQTLNDTDKTVARDLIYEHLSLAIELELPGKTIGIIHADFPENAPWNDIYEPTFVGSRENIMHCLWSRTRHKCDQPKPVEGLDYLITGHTAGPHVIKRANVIFLDTGSGYHPSARLPYPALSLMVFESTQIAVYSANRYFGIKQEKPILLDDL